MISVHSHNHSIIDASSLLKASEQTSFLKKLETIANDQRKMICELFQKEQTLLNSCCICLTGSDGRCENPNPGKDLEVMVFHKGKESNELKKIKEIFTEKLSLIPENIEQFDLSSEEELPEILWSHNADGSHEMLSPTRGLDADFVCGEKPIFKTFKYCFTSQLQKLSNKDYTKLCERSFFQRIYKQSQNGVKTTAGNSIEQYDLKEEKFFYDGNDRSGVKYTHLRAIQVVVARCIFKNMRAKTLPLEQLQDFIHKLPSQTIPRLEIIYTIGWLKLCVDDTLLKIQSIYRFSMHCQFIAKNGFHEKLKDDRIKLLEFNMKDTPFTDYTLCLQKFIEEEFNPKANTPLP